MTYCICRLKELKGPPPRVGYCVQGVCQHSIIPKCFLCTAKQKPSVLHWFVLSTGKVVSEDVMLMLPPNVIQGSARCSISVIGKAFHWGWNELTFHRMTLASGVGFWLELFVFCFFSSPLCVGDLMGRALKNLDRLLRMPSGCGEQNMIVLAPNIYILRYLEVTAQLTTAIRATATGYLQSGMEKQSIDSH